MNYLLKKTTFIIFIFFAFLHAVNAIDAKKLSYQGFVTDYASMLNEAEKLRLQRLCESIESATGAEVAVVIIPSLEGENLEDFTNTLFNSWGIGKKGTDNGVMLLIARDEKKIRIETGYGAEGVLPDSIAFRIISDNIAPYFRSNDFASGIYSGVYAIGTRFAAEKNVSIDSEQPAAPVYKTRKLTAWEKIKLIIFLLIFIPILIKNPWLIFFIMSSGRSGRYGGGGFGGGGFGGFGGGSSGGGGASGGW